jgi:hypothetical protein
MASCASNRSQPKSKDDVVANPTRPLTIERPAASSPRVISTQIIVFVLPPDDDRPFTAQTSTRIIHVSSPSDDIKSTQTAGGTGRDQHRAADRAAIRRTTSAAGAKMGIDVRTRFGRAVCRSGIHIFVVGLYGWSAGDRARMVGRGAC